MESFKDYLVKEYQIKNAAAIDMKFSHTMSVKLDKESKKPMNMHVITVSLKFYDKDLTLLKSDTVKFVNNELAKTCEKKLVNIAPKELNNKFMAARKHIIKAIESEYNNKMDELKGKIKQLTLYAGKPSIVVDDEFRGELVQINDDDELPTKPKKSFDM